jgi:DNA-binding LacI/PurR family transcriptional regulator
VTGKPTSFDIAYLAGVSQPTVSRALRGSTSVSEQTRKRVEAIAKQLNYKVDKNASNLRSQHSNTLALLFFEDSTVDDSSINPFYLSMLGSITRACATHGYDLLISFQQLSGDWHVDYEDSRKADGLILLGYGDYVEYEPTLRRLVEQDTHFVRWGSPEEGQIGTTIGSDNAQGGQSATAHLIAQGCQTIAFLGTATDHYPEFHARYQGYCAALVASGITPDPALQVDALTSQEEGKAAMRALLQSDMKVDAVFAAADLIALGAMSACLEAGLKVPDDIAIVGFDDIPSASFTTPPLTTVAQDVRMAGLTLVETLLAQIRNQPSDDKMLPTRLVVRGSSKR